MNIKSISALIAITTIAAGCSSMKVTSERAPDYDFNTTKTFLWVDGPEEVLTEDDTYINEDIQKALTVEFTKLGMQQVTNAVKADVQIAYYVKLREEFEYTAPDHRDEREFSGGFVYNRDSNWSYEEREPDLNVYAVEIGTLTVLVYDAKTGQRVWRGNLQTKIDRSKSKEEQQERVQIASKKLMERFPGKSK